MIEMKQVSKWFSDFKALDNIDFEVKKGEKIVICGPSGSGKSTLIRCLNGLEAYDEGSIVIGGTKLEDSVAVLREIRQKVGMVFQQFNLFGHLTIMENLTLAPMKVLGLSQKKARDRAFKFLELVQIADQAHKYPSQLSGGQQQRVAIARTLCMEPSILLFDEPTSALDPEMIKEVLDVMKDLASRGTTMVCVTHEMAFARQVADRVVFMDKGAIVETAPTDVFFTSPQSERTKWFLGKILGHAP